MTSPPCSPSTSSGRSRRPWPVGSSIAWERTACSARLRSSFPPGLRSLASGAYVTINYLGGKAARVRGRFAGWKGCVVLTVCVQLVTMALAQYFWSRRRTVNASLRA